MQQSDNFGVSNVPLDRDSMGLATKVLACQRSKVLMVSLTVPEPAKMSSILVIRGPFGVKTGKRLRPKHEASPKDTKAHSK